MSPPSSLRSGAAWVLQRKRSRVGTVLWGARVAVLAAAGLAVMGPAYVTVAAGLAVVAYATATFPRAPGPLVYARGCFSLPRCGATALVLGAGTSFTRWWAHLELVGTGGHPRHTVLVWADELRADDWRRLQLLLREPEPEAAGATARRRDWT